MRRKYQLEAMVSQRALKQTKVSVKSVNVMGTRDIWNVDPRSKALRAKSGMRVIWLLEDWTLAQQQLDTNPCFQPKSANL